MPDCFKKDFPKTRGIMDATEIYVQSCKNSLQKQATFSYYKNDNIVKTLVVNTPGGLSSYHSECYGGSTSDRQVVERSGLPKKFDAGDTVMADKGFTVQDIFAAYGVTVAMPHFKKGGNLSLKEIMQDRKLSKYRVHIERVIGLLKTYKILSTTLCHSYVPLTNEIVGVCVMLINFKECIRENILKKKNNYMKICTF